MTTQNGDSADDAFWRRPAGDPEPQAEDPAPPPAPAASHYPGPPPSTMPPPGWRPPLHVQPPPPRRLPPQDSAALDAAEANARTVTYGVGLISGAALLVVMCLLCSRVLL